MHEKTFDLVTETCEDQVYEKGTFDQSFYIHGVTKKLKVNFLTLVLNFDS